MELQEISPIYKYVGDPSLFEALDRYGGVKGKKILDFGCALGKYSALFVSKGAEFVLGTDISNEGIAVAKARVRSFLFQSAVPL